MWTVIKIDKKSLALLKIELMKKFGDGGKIYYPKLLLKKIEKNQLRKKEINILGDYLFCYHDQFVNPLQLQKLSFLKGVKYFLNGFKSSQEEINNFILKFRGLEDENGYISKNVYEEKVDAYYKFSSGPFSGTIFKILALQKNKIDILMGNLKTSVSRKELLFNPI
jgi:hypothetical protein